MRSKASPPAAWATKRSRHHARANGQSTYTERFPRTSRRPPRRLRTVRHALVDLLRSLPVRLVQREVDALGAARQVAAVSGKVGGLDSAGPDVLDREIRPEGGAACDRRRECVPCGVQ